MKQLSDAGKEELALALILWKDFKSNGRFDLDITKIVFELAENLGVKAEFEKLLSKIPPMRIEPR